MLGNNQPNITHSMNRLESQLNCVLFIRSNRGVTLTPEGELLYSRIASGIASAFYGLAVPDAGSSLCNVKNILLLYTGYFLHILCTLV